MKNNKEENQDFKFVPVLNGKSRRLQSQSTSEKFRFKKTSTLEKPKFKYYNIIYREKSPEPKKLLVIEPFERKHAFVVSNSVLGKKYKEQPRSVSVIPEKKVKLKELKKEDWIFLPVLATRKHYK
ncbi:hypothetical protein SteCoe_19802 [Stentor coeruleus]|uniref:Uncharacterized protein n=1 Tax=Stentor coeruleus TaxID=5963 RepID=A0A1R2BTK8_9CILI|nr:hypothetical protein SteCoe_19802 [Stentor coeruleus]